VDWIKKLPEKEKLKIKKIEYYVRKRFIEENIKPPTRLLPCWITTKDDPEKVYQSRKKIILIKRGLIKKNVYVKDYEILFKE